MSKTAFIYPGQGAQKAGMGADFYENSATARNIFDKAHEALDFDLKTVCFEENEKINMTEYTQAAMVTTCLAMTRVLMEKGLKPDITAGLSLGEYAAIAVAGAMDDIDAIRLVRKRGILMQNTVPAGVGSMCAVLGLDASVIEQVISGINDVTIANYNCPGQIVITGKTEGITKAAEDLKTAGAKRCVVLNVSGPFHSPMLISAGEQLRTEIEKVTLNELNIPYVTNVTAQTVTDKNEICDLLTRQVASSVRWQQSVENMLADGVDRFVEIGPGKTLAAFIKKINPEAVVYNVTCWDDVEKVAGELC